MSYIFDKPKNSNTVLSDGWQDCTESMPENINEVLLIHKNYNHVMIGYYYDIGNRWYLRKELGHIDTSEITHWMPLPDPPTFI
jgi:hypothetical protein